MEKSINNILKIKSNECVGCFACKQACQKNCISIIEVGLGEKIPSIDETKCVNCGACLDVCQIKDSINGQYPEECFSYVSNDKESINNSASGGAFFDIAKKFINDGIVYGVVFINNIATHIRAADIETLTKMQGSKYVQSDTSNIFLSVKKDLDCGNKVLFSGTPCQVYGLNKFLRKKYTNLFTIDIVCHGVPGDLFFKEYLSFVEKENKRKISQIHFRLKNSFKIYNKCRYNETLVFCDNTKKIRPYYASSYYYFFLNKAICRESCYSCKFANIKRISDMTLGDFWGIKRKNKIYNTDFGCSLILVNNKQGKKLLDFIENEINPENISRAIECNEQLRKPSEKPINIYETLRLKYKSGYNEVDKFYKKRFIKERFFGFIKRNTPRFIKEFFNHEK